MADRRQSYIYGSTARVMEPIPRHPEVEPEKKQQKQVSRQVNRNRNRAQKLDLQYVLFLTVCVSVVLFACVQYLQLQATITSRSSNITALQLEIAELAMDNDAALGAIEDSVNLDVIRERAEELGMVYVDSSQVVEYQSSSTSYVKQYEDIPESGILAQSDTISE